MQSKNKFLFLSLAVTGVGISGGDRIFIELARNWSKKNKITIHTSFQGARLIKKQNLSSKNIKIVTIPNRFIHKNFVLDYFFKTFYSIYLGFKINPKQYDYIYTSSEFIMDVFASCMLRWRSRKTKWIATWYQTAPNPLIGFTETKRENKYNFRAFLYWLSQIPTRPLINRYSDKVLVNNEDEKKRFPNKQTIVLIGAVPLYLIKEYIKKNKNIIKKYDAVFQGRFHAQKGVVEMIEIWRKIVDKKPNAKLAMVGDGDLMKDVKSKIEKLNLQKNIKLFGYLFDGNKKFEVFSQSKIVVHPAFYDSGGMAAAEAMAFGLPAVGFDLVSYKSYYPKGMLKAKPGDLDSFSDAILSLLSNRAKYVKYSSQAKRLIEENYSWKKRSQQIYEQIEE